MRKRRLLYDSLSEQVREKRTVRYTCPVFDEWQELVDFLSDVVVGRLKVEQNCYWTQSLAMDEFPKSIVEVLEWFGKDDVIVYIDRLGEFKIECEDEDMRSDAILSIADRRFVGDLEPLGLIVEEHLKYV
jgi:hypothetical protein